MHTFDIILRMFTKFDIDTYFMGDLKDKEVFTINDAAEYLSVSRRTIYNWMSSGVIKGTRLSPKKVLIYKEDILKIFRESTGYESPKQK